MFILCPHCHFLVSVDPRTGAPPPLCPKCGGALDESGPPAMNQASAEPTEAPLPEAPAPAIPTSEAAPSSAPPDDAAPPRPATPAPQLSAEALIAAMAAKPARRTGGTRRKGEAAGDRAATSREPAAPPASTRPSRAKRSPPPEAAASAAAPAATSATAKPPGKRADWWSRLRDAARARAAKAAAAEAARTAAPPDPLAASVRNRARARRAENPASAIPKPPPVAVDATEPKAAVMPAAASPAPSADTAHAAAQEREVTQESRTAAADTAAVSAPTATAPAEALATAAETAAPPVPFVERRRNPDLPIPPGTVPTHPLRRRTDAPSFARPQPVIAPTRRNWRWPVAVAALSLLLVLQLLLAQRDLLAADARWRPMVASLCAALRCSLPPWREPAAFTMLGRDVRAHPTAPGALLIHASFRNDARWPQPWPRVLLTLSNVDGRVVGARAFAAREYLGADAAQAHELAPGQTAAISLAVVEPAPDIVAFSFDFR